MAMLNEKMTIKHRIWGLNPILRQSHISHIQNSGHVSSKVDGHHTTWDSVCTAPLIAHDDPEAIWALES